MTPESARPQGRQAYAFVLAGGRGTRLKNLTDWRAKPAVPFGGMLSIIDFSLSNCVNSGVRRIGVLTQYKAQSLIRHLERAWGFLEASLGEYVDVIPAQQRIGDDWYCGTADAVYQNLDLLREARATQVLVLAGDHVYKMDYRRLLAEHAASGAAATVATVELPIAQAGCFGVLACDSQRRVTAFEEKPARPLPMPQRPDHALVSMGVYAFGADALCAALERDAVDAASTHDFGHDVLPRLVRTAHVHAHRFADSCVECPGAEPYWRDVGTVDAYWQANLDFTRAVPELDLYDADWPIRGLPRQLPPGRFVSGSEGGAGSTLDSSVAGGCIVSGATLRRALLFPNVRVGERSLIEDSVVLGDVQVGRGVTLRRTVVDQGCVLHDGFKAGVYAAEDRAHFHVTDSGITLITPQMLGQHAHPMNHV